MDEKLTAAATKLSKSLRLVAGVGKNQIIVYLFDGDVIPNYIPINFDGFNVVVRKTGRIIPARG